MIAASNPDARILIVDDELGNVRVLKRVLAVAGYRRVTAITDPRDAIARFAEIAPDLLLLDLHMPEIDGVAVMERLRAGMPPSEYFPILMLTGDNSPRACQRALAMGASDFIAKPFDMHEVLIRIKNLLETRSLHRQVAEHNHQLERKVRERTAELDTAHLDTIARLALAAEFRDDETGRHTQRVGALAELLAQAMGWSNAEAALLRLAAPLHDVGKIGIPDSILCKAALLTVRERKIMEGHTTIGAKILSGGRSSFIQLAEKVALSHHERWDGKGYPERRLGPAIPAAARIVAVADFFDATVHDRVYRKAWPINQVLAAIAAMSGSAFDPAVAELCSRPEVQDAMVGTSSPSSLDVSASTGAVIRAGYSLMVPDIALTPIDVGLSSVEIAEDTPPIDLLLEPRLRPMEILLAEDNPINQMLTVEILSKRGHIVRVAPNGQKAVEAFERERFDLVLMDVQMPVMGGCEATAAIREVEKVRGGHIPIIALTAQAMKGDRELCLAAGMDGYLTKPIKPLALVQEVERLTLGKEPAVAGLRGADDARLLDHFMGDAGLLCSVAEVFLESETGLRSQLAGALSCNDGMEVSRTAHSLKGSVGNFGAEKAMALAGELELMGRGNNLSGAGIVFESLVETLDDLRFQLSATMQAHVAPAVTRTGADRLGNDSDPAEKV